MSQAQIPPYMELPYVEEDCRFTRSFRIDEVEGNEVQEFQNRYGFVIFRDV